MASDSNDTSGVIGNGPLSNILVTLSIQNLESSLEPLFTSNPPLQQFLTKLDALINPDENENNGENMTPVALRAQLEQVKAQMQLNQVNFGKPGMSFVDMFTVIFLTNELYNQTIELINCKIKNFLWRKKSQN